MSGVVLEDSGPVLDLTALAGRAPSAVLLTEVRAPAFAIQGGLWSPGPLPVVQHRGTTSSPTTNEAARRTLIAEHQANVLYGTSALKRAHLVVPHPRAEHPSVIGLELLLGPQELEGQDVAGVLAIHVAGSGTSGEAEGALADHLAFVSAVVHEWPNASSTFWAGVRGLLPHGLDFEPSSRVRSVSFAVGPRAPTDMERVVQAWAYYLVTASPTARWQDMAQRALGHPLTIRRDDWSALVLRDGAAFIAHQRTEEPFTDALRVYTHTIHLDAILLGLLQRRLVDLSGARAVSAPVDDPRDLVALERSYFEFKRSYWRTSITVKRTSPSDEVLRAFQAELLTALDVAEVENRVRDGARLARTLHGENQAESQKQLARMVQNVSVIVGAFGLAFTAAPTLGQPSLTLFAIAAAAGAVGVGGAFAVLRIMGRRAGSTGSANRTTPH